MEMTAKDAVLVGKRALGRLRRFVYSSGEFRVYQLNQEAALEFDNSSALICNDLSHADCFLPEEKWHPDPIDFKIQLQRRILDGNHFYSAIEDGRLVHWSWLTFPAESIDCDFGFGRFSLPQHAAKLWDDNTIKSARGRGLHSLSIRQRAQEAARAGARLIFIGVRADNYLSRRNIEKVGFRLVTRMKFRRILGLELRRTESAFADDKMHP